MPAPPKRRKRVPPSPIRKVLGDNLIRAREQAGMTQSALSAASGVAQNYISMIEHAETSAGIDIIARLAECIGSTPAHLLTSTGRRSKPR